MKQIIPLLLILTLLLVGCSTQTPPVTTPSVSEKVDTDKIAEDFVKSLTEYSDYNGRDLTMIRKVTMGFDKWDYTYRFAVNTQQLPASVKFFEVRLMILGGEVTNNLAVEVDDKDIKKGALTQSECESMGGRLANNIAGAFCNNNEKNTGEMVGIIIPYICCV